MNIRHIAHKQPNTNTHSDRMHLHERKRLNEHYNFHLYKWTMNATQHEHWIKYETIHFSKRIFVVDSFLHQVDTVTPMNDDKLYLPFGFLFTGGIPLYTFELMHFKCLLVVALAWRCVNNDASAHNEMNMKKRRRKNTKTRSEWHSTQSKLQEYCISYWSFLLKKKDVNWWLLPEEMS